MPDEPPLSLEFARTEVAVPSERVRSLVWRGNELVDWVAGGRTFALDGPMRERRVRYSYRFDAAAGSPSGKYSVIYERCGTKALLLREGQIVRELNRSFYYADVYEYPVCLFALPDGREVIAHCPDEYCDAVIEDVETGERLTAPQTGHRRSLFHSRLAASLCGKFLLTAGWVWHPCNVVRVWELRRRADGLIELHNPDSEYLGDREVASAGFAEGGRVFVSTSSDSESFDNEGSEAVRLGPMTLGSWDLTTNCWALRTSVPEEVGALMPVGDQHAVGFYEHPKLFDLATGQVVQRWPDLHTGRQLCSIIHHLKSEDLPPPMALDSGRRRFAVAQEQRITVVQFK